MRNLLWLYWWLNKPFLRAFAPTLIGQGKGDLDPDGREIIERLQGLLKDMPFPVFAQAMLALFFLPVWVPRRLPYARFWRFLQDIWAIFASHLARIGFVLSGPEARAAKLDRIFHRLDSHAAAVEDDLIKSIIMLQSMKTLLTSTYLDLDRTWRGLGYQPYTERSWNPPSGPDLANPPELPQDQVLARAVRTPQEVAKKPGDGRTTYLILGGGAGGAITAHTIAQEDPKARILIVDSGPFVKNTEFSQHLMTSAAELYMNGAMTLSANQKYIFVQARCIGGGTVLNNSVALKPEGFWWDDVIVDRWSWLGAELDWPRLHGCYDDIMQMINVHPIDPRVLTPMAESVRKGFEDIGMPVERVTCNLKDCVGCGRCNVGCQYGAKQSMTVSVLPQVVEKGALLVPETHVTRLALEGHEGQQTCRGAHVRHNDREILIEADKVVLAAGAYASTKVLRRSGFAGANAGVRTVGKRFSGNIGTPVFGRFPKDQEQLAWKGQQVSYMMEMPRERLVVEAAFAPPPAFGMQAAQWGPAFMANVEAFDYLAAAVPVLGSSAYGDITYGPAPSGFAIYFKFNDEDWFRLARGIRRCAEAFFAAGAEEVYTTRFDAKTICRPEEIDSYVAATGPLQYLKLTTAHLQGGNVINRDSNQGVVDEQMKVYGIDRLWITDASVMPAPITLNVQLTIMALARYAAPGIAAA